MQRGAVAMIDALGFKGIWRRGATAGNPSIVVERLKTLRRAAIAESESILPSDLPSSVRSLPFELGRPAVSFLSDTIVLAVSITGQHSKHADYRALRLLSNHLSKLLTVAGLGHPALAYRGCVSVGDYLIEDSFVLGPAIDEVASTMELAQGAFVWLSPSARDGWETGERESNQDFTPDGLLQELVPILEKAQRANSGIVPYGVPLKSGGVFETLTVCPFRFSFSRTYCERISSSVLDTFHGDLSVEVKKQNTERYLKAATESVLSDSLPLQMALNRTNVFVEGESPPLSETTESEAPEREEHPASPES